MSRADRSRSPTTRSLAAAVLAAFLLVLAAAVPAQAAPADEGVSVAAAGESERLSAGEYHTCAIKTDGTPTCWGNDGYGQAPADPGVGTVSAITAGANHTCAIKTDGTATCWGYNGYGQRNVPAGVGTVSAMTAGDNHTCAIRTDGTPTCWGNNGNGQAPVDPAVGTVSAITAGAAHTCAIKTDGTPVCWGNSDDGQATVPAGVATVSAITAGAAYTCAIETDGTPTCWGDNEYGQAPADPGVGTVSAITAGDYHTCAIKTGGTPTCWGFNDDGQAPADPGVGTVSAITTGNLHTCGIKTDGTPTCWGNNDYGQTNVPPGVGTVSAITAGGYHTCAIKTDGTATCWGSNFYGQLGAAPSAPGPQPEDGYVGEAYGETLAGSGRPAAKFSVVSGSLPDGLSLSQGGVLSGTPTDNGDYTFTVRARNVLGAQQTQFTVHVFNVLGSTEPPQLTGATKTGATLHATAGAWEHEPEDVSYRWVRCDSDATNCIAVGADSPEYLLSDADLGKRLRVRVTATDTDSDSRGTRRSVLSTVVGAPIMTASPRITGIAKAGETLTAQEGSWDPAGTYTFRWRRCDPDGTNCQSITGTPDADDGNSTYTPTGEDTGKRISVRVTATNTHGATRASSTATRVVGAPVNTTEPAISGRRQAGRTLTADKGDWDPAGDTYTYTWRRCGSDGKNCQDITGSSDADDDDATYTLTGANVGFRISVRVTATNDHGSRNANSRSVGPIAGGS